MLFSNDVVLIDEAHGEVNEKLEVQRQTLESKGLVEQNQHGILIVQVHRLVACGGRGTSQIPRSFIRDIVLSILVQ